MRVSHASIGAVLLLATLAPAAHGEERIFAWNVQYTNRNVTMDQGEPLYFRNLDRATHDVTARASGPDSQPLFKTPLIGQGEEAFVEGSQYLTTGSYDFFCTVHPQMTGTLNVTTAGTPVPRPAPGTTPSDTTAPTVEVKIRSSRLSRVRRSRRLAVQVEVNEAARVAMRAVARLSGRRVMIAKGSVDLTGAGTRREAIKVTKAGRRALATRSRLTVTLSARATDRAGNVDTDRARRTLRR